MIKQDRIHGRTVADGWVGAIMQKPLAIQKYDGRTSGGTDGQTNTARYSRMSATKNGQRNNRESGVSW